MKATDENRSRAVGLLVKAAKVIVPLCVSVGLVVWLFHKVNFSEVMALIRRGVDWRYIAAMMVLTVLSHTIRGIRWGIQLRAAGLPRIPTLAYTVSIYGAYALNIVFPYLGEAWRCLYMSRREGAKLSTVVGTDIGDRASDGLMIALIIVLTMFVAHDEMMRFLDHYSIGESIHRIADDSATWIGVGLAVVGLVAADYLLRRTAVVRGINASIARMWSGFAVLFRMPHIGMYLILTLGIWTCYFLETYAVFYAFPFTRELIAAPGSCHGLIPGLVVFVFGSCSMIVPSNGGLGPWNIAVMFALSLYGISDAEGTAYSLVYWSLQSTTLIALGIFSAIYIASSKGREKQFPI